MSTILRLCIVRPLDFVELVAHAMCLNGHQDDLLGRVISETSGPIIMEVCVSFTDKLHAILIFCFVNHFVRQMFRFVRHLKDFQTAVFSCAFIAPSGFTLDFATCDLASSRKYYVILASEGLALQNHNAPAHIGN